MAAYTLVKYHGVEEYIWWKDRSQGTAADT